MRQETVNVYKFDELSDRAKEKAREWYRNGNLDYDWWENTYEMANTAAKLLGIDLDRKSKGTPTIYFSGFSRQGDGACFEGEWHYKKGWRKAVMAEFGEGDVRTELLALGQALMAAAAPQFYRVNAICTHRGHYNHSGCMQVEVNHNDSRWRDIGDAEEDVRQALRDFADWIYNRLESEYDYLNSDEQVDESIKANEHEFYADGSIH